MSELNQNPAELTAQAAHEAAVVAVCEYIMDEFSPRDGVAVTVECLAVAMSRFRESHLFDRPAFAYLWREYGAILEAALFEDINPLH